MYVLFTDRRAYSGGGGAVADADLQIRGGGGGYLVSEKKGGQFQKKIFRPQFGLKIRGAGGRGCPGPSPGSATGGML